MNEESNVETTEIPGENKGDAVKSPAPKKAFRAVRGVKTLRVIELMNTMGVENKGALVQAIMDEFKTSKANANAFIFNARKRLA